MTDNNEIEQLKKFVDDRLAYYGEHGQAEVAEALQSYIIDNAHATEHNARELIKYVDWSIKEHERKAAIISSIALVVAFFCFFVLTVAYILK